MNPKDFASDALKDCEVGVIVHFTFNNILYRYEKTAKGVVEVKNG